MQKRYKGFNKRPHGFTLLEVMIALAVVSITVVGLSSVATSSHSGLSHLENKTLAHMVAMNKMTEIMSSDTWPEIGTDKDVKLEMANRRWEVKTVVRKAAGLPNVRVIEVFVGLRNEALGEDAAALQKLRAFKSNHF